MPAEPGLLLVDKPAGITSHAAVQAARRALGLRRIGHTGTLDPFATGLLLLCVGVFTRAAEYFHTLPKRYSATMRLGQQTDTDDLTGRVIRESDGWRALDAEAIAAAVGSRIGSSEQVPSTFSAKKIDGVRAYREARAGRVVELAPVSIIIHEASVTRSALPDVWLDVTVSTGTYVRALARDIGEDLGCGAHLTELRRTRIGPFGVEDACGPEMLATTVARGGSRCWRGAAAALDWLPHRELAAEEVSELEQGRAIEIGAPVPSPTLESPIALIHGDRLVAIGQLTRDSIQPRKVFPR